MLGYDSSLHEYEIHAGRMVSALLLALEDRVRAQCWWIRSIVLTAHVRVIHTAITSAYYVICVLMKASLWFILSLMYEMPLQV